MEETGEGTSELPELNIDELIENNFELLQARKNPTVASPKRSHPVLACQHCGWTAQGARQIFVNHIIGEAGKGRREICKDVPLEVALLFQTASSKNIEVVIPVESGGGSSEPEYTIPAVDDKYLSSIDNFEAEFWSRDKFIQEFQECNRKSRLSAMTLQRMYREFFTMHRDKWDSIKRYCSDPSVPQRSIQQVLSHHLQLVHLDQDDQWFRLNWFRRFENSPIKNHPHIWCGD